jgi:SWI/SNF-related matrix-associated actin-dependent regulator 1 of chromatin subfamily A
MENSGFLLSTMAGQIGNVVYPIDKFMEICENAPKPKQFPKKELVNFLSKPMIRNTSLVLDLDKYPAELKEKILGSQYSTIVDIIQLYNGRCSVAAEAGSGKTPISSVVAKFFGGRILVISTLSAYKSFKDNALRWAGLKLDYCANKNAPLGDNVITTYETVVRHEKILREKWDFIIIDESHLIKNREAIRTKMIIPLILRTPRVLLLSATPQTRDLSDLYTQISSLLPRGIIGSYYQFTERYMDAKMVPQYGVDKWTLGKERFLGELNMVLSRCMIRLEREITEEIKPLSRISIDVPVTDDAYAKMLSLRDQITECDDVLEKMQLASELYRFSGLSKIPAAVRWCLNWFKENPPGEKLIIWVKSVDVCETLSRMFDNHNISNVVINGKTKTEVRHDIITSLCTIGDTKYQVGILTYKTCSLGVCLAPACYTSVSLEIPTIPADLDQAENKLNRLGQVRQVTSYLLKCEVESFVYQKLQRRTNTTSLVLDNKPKHLKMDVLNTRDSLFKSMGLKKKHIEQIMISIGEEDSIGSIINKIGKPNAANANFKAVDTIKSRYVNEPTILFDSILDDAIPVCLLIP